MEQPLSGCTEYREIRHAEAVLDIDGESHRALFAEARWSDVFAGLSKPSLRRTLSFAVMSLPLLAWVVGPDRRDLAVLRGEPSKSPFPSFSSAENQAVGRLIWRLTTLAVLALAMLYVLLASSALLLLLLLVGLAWWGRSHWNLVWHVRMASIDEEGTEQLLSHLHRRLRWMEGHCDEVVVVAHSQGGYLMHRVLSPAAAERHPGVRRLVGVGSGLKPITLLKTLHSGGIGPAVWLAVCTVPLYLSAVGPLVWKMLDWSLTSALRLLYTLLRLTVLPLASMEAPDVWRSWATTALTEMSRPFLSMPSLALSWTQVIALAVSLCTFRFAGLRIREALRTDPPPAMALDGGMDWHEYSSPHDIVGRMLLPALPPRVDQPWISATGQPVWDHITYFRPSGVLPRLLAADLLSDLVPRRQPPSAVADVVDGWDRAARDFDHARRMQATRRRTLHGLLLGCAASPLPVVAISRGISVPRTLLGSWPFLGLVLLALTLLFSFVAHRSAKASARGFAARLTGSPGPSATPWHVRIVPPRARVAPAAAAGTGGVIAVFGSVHFGMTGLRHGQGTAWAGFGVLLPLGLGLLLLACASAAGYPVRKRWPVLLAPLLLLAAYPPSPLGLPWQFRAEVTLMACLGACLSATLAGVAHAAARARDLAAPATTAANASPVSG
ncbi:hypothetical protein ACFVHW_03445 [Streptomyces sp. NPDC127110]|uniref:hypothetical protein n=1 Tax=Streptomyces sp. NPDC127110 TaxID=3345362 RepID=UPI0036341840